MKTILTAIAAALFILLPAPVFSAYVIHLKDGTRFVTDQYSEEGDQIKFKRYGGLIGLEKALVRDIEEIEDLPEKEKRSETDASAAAAETGKKERPQEQAPGGDTLKPDGAGGDEKTGGKGPETEKRMPTELSEEEKEKTEQEKQAFLDEKRRLVEEMEAATAAFNEAKTTKNKEKKDHYWNELLSLQKKLAGLRDRVMAEHGGEVPAWWDSD